MGVKKIILLIEKAFLFSQNNELLFVENVPTPSKTLMANGAENKSSFSFQTRRGNCPYLEQGRSVVSCCVRTVGYLSSMLYTGGKFAIYEFIISSHFY